MIFTDSRYATGALIQAVDARVDKPQLAVLRQFPSATTDFTYYTWTQRDRVDLIANRFLGDPSLWWVIMDFNPEQINPMTIPVGTLIRIPNA
jgi:nucleoid-associated protein YgaU